MITIEVEIPIDPNISDETKTYEMDVDYSIHRDFYLGQTIEVNGCFIEEIPRPTGDQQYIMHHLALEYLDEHFSELAENEK